MAFLYSFSLDAYQETGEKNAASLKYSHSISTIAKLFLSFFLFSSLSYFVTSRFFFDCEVIPKKRPEMEWKKFGEHKNVNGMFD